MVSKKDLAKEGLLKALKVRSSLQITPEKAICIFDVTEKFGLDVRFVDFPSMEGLYLKDENQILVCSERPSGRKAFTCGHELAHHVFGHSIKVDKFMEDWKAKDCFEPEEFLANCFSGFLLMPKLAVFNGFSSRKWKIEGCNPIQFYAVSNWLGVGYATLINHMTYSLILQSYF